MVLAALDARRQQQADPYRRPSLIVVPRSLVYNWEQAAQRSAPDLKVVDCSGSERHAQFDQLADAIVRADEHLIRTLTKEGLEVLLT